jgi:hypothetical protein
MKVFDDSVRADAMAHRARQVAQARLDTSVLQGAMEAVILQAIQARRTPNDA